MNVRGTVSLLACFAFVPAPARSAQWLDRGEYDIVMSIRSEASAQKQVELLDTWAAQYPKSELRQERRVLYLNALEALGDGGRMLKIAREMLGEEPNNLVAVYWCAVLVPEVRGPSPDILDIGEKAARQLLAGMDAYFAPEKKPAGASDAEWKASRRASELLAHRALGWVAWQRGNYADAEQEFRAYLDMDPNNGEIDYWMGIVSGMQKEPGKKAASLWYLERAGSLKGEGALPDDQRRSVAALADRVYALYHGDSGGLENLKAATLATAVPLADFRVETVSYDPPARWKLIRAALESPDAESRLDSLRSRPLPRLQGTVIKARREAGMSVITLAMGESKTEDVLLDVSPALAPSPSPGAQLAFEGGIVVSFEKPLLKVSVGKGNVTMLPR